jgi:hypothetical protein
MDAAQIGTIVGVAIAMAVVIPLIVGRQRKKLEALMGVLEQSGPMTFDAIAKKLETSVFAKGYLMQALDRMVAEGRLKKTPPPKGTPALRIVRETTYEVVSASAGGGAQLP